MPNNEELNELEPQVNDQIVNDDQKNDLVKYETYSKVLGQGKKYQSRAKELEAELNAMKAEREVEANAQLVEQNKFQELYVASEEKIAAIKQENEAIKSEVANSRKRQALKTELGQIKKDQYLQFADMDSISFNEDGTIDSESVKQVAGDFRKNYSDLLAVDEKLPPSNAPGKAPGKLSHDEWLKLSAADQKLRLHEVFNKD